MPRNQDGHEDNNSECCDKSVMAGLGGVGLVGSAGVGLYEAETIICAGAWTGWNVCFVSSAAGCALASIVLLLRGCASGNPPAIELQNIAVEPYRESSVLETVPFSVVSPYDAASATSYGSTSSGASLALVSSSSGNADQLTAAYAAQKTEVLRPEDEKAEITLPKLAG